MCVSLSPVKLLCVLGVFVKKNMYCMFVFVCRASASLTLSDSFPSFARSYLLAVLLDIYVVYILSTCKREEASLAIITVTIYISVFFFSGISYWCLPS